MVCVPQSFHVGVDSDSDSDPSRRTDKSSINPLLDSIHEQTGCFSTTGSTALHQFIHKLGVFIRAAAQEFICGKTTYRDAITINQD